MRSPNFGSREHNFSKKRRSRFFFWLFLALVLLGLAFLASTAIAFKFFSASQKVIEKNPPRSFFESVKDAASQRVKPLRGEAEGRINILLLGLAGENYPGENLTDSIIIASINPKTYQTAMLSIPRDFFVQIPGTNSYTKINALYARGKDKHGKTDEGVEELKTSLEEITAQPIHYYIALDFDGFQQVIDELGGVNIQVPKDFRDERYPGPNFSYETFEIKEGLHNLDGKTALKYARTRHDEDGDFGRSDRQQHILEATRSKAFSIGTLMNLPAIGNILDILGDHLRTNIPLDELHSFLELSKKIDTHTTVNKVLDAGKPESVLSVSHVYLGGVRAFVLVPRTGDYEEVHEIAKEIFELDQIKRKQEEIKRENSKVAIVNQTGVRGFETKLVSLLKKFGYDSYVEKLPAAKNRTIAYQTSIYDFSEGLKPFSLEDISKKLGAGISSDGQSPAWQTFPNKKPDFLIVAGSNLANKLDFEENTIAELEKEYDHQQIDERKFIELLKKGSDKMYNQMK